MKVEIDNQICQMRLDVVVQNGLKIPELLYYVNYSCKSDLFAETSYQQMNQQNVEVNMLNKLTFVYF